MNGAQRYLIALGSNMRHPRHGGPTGVLRAALRTLDSAGVEVVAVSRIIASAPLGPSLRRYANAAAAVETALEPEALLDLLQCVEAQFGRVRRGQRWRARVLDLDIALWSSGYHRSRRLIIPHPQMARRSFVLAPAVEIARDWRQPGSARTLAHLLARLTRPRPTPR